MPSRSTGSRARGFTLIELMVVVAMLSILVALALPSFKGVIERWRVQQAVDSLRTTMFYARSEAIRRGGDIFVEKLPSTTPGCTLATRAGDWDCGWVVFIDANSNRRWDSGEEIQRYAPAQSLTVTRSAASATIAVDRWGVIGGGDAVGFSIAPYAASSNPAVARNVCISPGGRIQVVAAQAENACAT